MSVRFVRRACALLSLSLLAACSGPREAAVPHARVALVAEGCTANGLVVTRRTVTDAIAAAGFVPLVLPNVALTNDVESLVDGADALVLFGAIKGSMPCRTDFEKRLVLRAAERGIPVVGFCRGHQIINKAFGGDIARNPTNAAVKVVHHGKDDPYVKDCFHPVSVKPGSLLARGIGEGEQTVNSSHNYSISRLAEGFDVTAVAPDGAIEAIEHRTLPIVGFQFHPERLASLAGDERCVRLIRLALEKR